LARVHLNGVSKVFPGGVAAVASVDLDVGDGELFVLVGPSGSGKSTLLRLIAGLESPTSGEIWIGAQRADRLAPAKRDVSMVFQNPARYPHLNVAGNLAFGLRARRVPKPETNRRVNAVAERLGLTGLLTRAPAALSGGQRQRVALGRAIVREPRVFLLDEPFSSLDTPLRAALKSELIELQRTLGTTMIHVTHDQAEAMAMGDRIAVMDQGHIVQVGTPLDVYQHPASRFVAGFIGSPPMNLLPCELEWSGETLKVQLVGFPAGPAWVTSLAPAWTRTLQTTRPTRADLGLRAEQIALANGLAEVDAPWNAQAEVRRLEPLGPETIATINAGPHPLHLRVPPATPLRVGDRVTIGIDPGRAAWFDTATGRAIPALSRIAG